MIIFYGIVRSIMPRYYSEDFRFQAVSCVKRGKSHEEVCDFFSIGIATLYRWLKQDKETGSVACAPRKAHRLRKMSVDKLRTLLDTTAYATLEELAASFDCCPQNIDYWCRKLKITRKKNHAVRGAGRGKKTKISRRNRAD